MVDMSVVSAQAVKELREVTGAGMMECKAALVETLGDFEAAKDFLRTKGQAKALKKSSRETPEGAIGMFIDADRKQAGMIKMACETDFVARNENFQKYLSQLSQHIAVKGDENLLEQTLSGTSETIGSMMARMVGELGENFRIMGSRQVHVASGVVNGYVHSTGKVGVLVALEAERVNGALWDLAKDIALHIAATHAEAISPDEISAEVIAKEREIFSAQARESGKPENIIEKMVEGRINKFMKEVCVLSQPFVKNPEKTIADLLSDAAEKSGKPVILSSFTKFVL